jgi:hypothetical protein
MHLMRMLSSRVAVVAAALVFTVAGVVAPAAVAQTVDELVARNIEAKGGAALLKSTTSVKTTGKGTMQGADVAVSTISKRPYYVRNEMSLGEQKMIQAFDGETLWMSMGGMPPQAAPPGPQIEAFKQSSQIDSPLLDYKARGTKITLGEPLDVDGKELHHLILTPKAGSPMHYYLDPETYLESRMVMEVDDGARKFTMEMRFSDFKTVEGRTVPFTVTQFVNGTQMGQMKFDRVEFNVPVDNAIFSMPK